MDLNLTLLGQMLTFAILVAFTMKYIWPYLMKSIEERQQKIIDGLAAADRGHHELEVAQHKAANILHDAKLKAAKYIEQANKRAAHTVEEAKEKARLESERILEMAQSDIAFEQNEAREQLRQEIATLVLQTTQKLISTKVDVEADNKLVEQFIAQVSVRD